MFFIKLAEENGPFEYLSILKLNNGLNTNFFFIMCNIPLRLSKVFLISWPKTDPTHYHVQLGLSDKGRTNKDGCLQYSMARRIYDL